ncbi:MAG: TolC family protein [Flavipsychrobacter sp.]|nr:TolC family protein [Flavipsychrobacter sp.]
MSGIKYITILIFCFGAAHAQLHLSMESAIARTLKHNFDISMADISVQQATRNNTLGNAGFAPTVALNATATKTWSNTYNELASGSVQNNPRASSVNYAPGLSVNWTIFDGGRMFLVKKQLGELESLTKEQLKLQVQAMVSRTIQMYAEVVWRQKQLLAVTTALSLAKTRMDISYMKYDLGAGAKVDYLQARVDYNARQSDSLTFVGNLAQARDSLIVLMGGDDDIPFTVDDSVALNTNLVPIDKERLKEVNLNLSVFRYNVGISRLNARIAKTNFLPQLDLNGGYNYSRTTNATGFSLFSRSYGPNVNLTLSVPVFDGGNIRRQAKVASLQAIRDDLLYQKQNTVVSRQYRTAWKNYQLAVAAYNLNNENIKYAKENLDVQTARFRVGVGTTLEVRQAENDYVTALQSLYTAAYNLKVVETVVLELENQLVK